jgi:serine/threonine protein kinase/Tol biopolymer transport system component
VVYVLPPEYQMICPQCEQDLRESALFCDGCGSPVSVAKSSDASAVSPSGPPAVEAGAQVGKIIDGKYRLISLLGEGGMGYVYRARRVQIGDEVAVKFLHRKYVNDAQAVERFHREAQAAAKIRHPAVVAIYDFGEARDDVSAYIVMELVEGRTIRKLLEGEGPLGAERAVGIVSEVCRGVGAAHKLDIVHRDIKPDNVMILPSDADEQRERVKVVDFGIAKLRDMAAGKTLTQTGRVLGTVYYMSPEQCCGEHLDARSDVYSLGAMLYEMLAGAPPFTAETATAVVAKHLSKPPPPLPGSAGVPSTLEAVVMRALGKDPRSRQEDALALGRELRAAIGSPLSLATSERPDGDEEARVTKSRTGDTSSAAVAPTREGAEALQGEPRAAEAGTRVARAPKLGRRLVVAALASALIGAAAYVFTREPRVESGDAVAQKPPAADASPQDGWQLGAVLKSNSKVYAVAFSPDDRLLATASSEGVREGGEFVSEVRLWNPATGELRKTLTERSEGVLSVAFSPDGRALAGVTGTGSAAAKIGKVKLWDTDTGELKWAVNGHTDFVTSVAYSPDGRLLASGSLDHTVKLWDAQSGRLHRSLPPRGGEINDVAFSPDGKTLAVAGRKSLELWNVESGELERALTGNRYALAAVAFSPDGRLLAGGDVGGVVGLWETGGGTLRQTLTGHDGIVDALAFAPDGKTLVSGSYDATVVIWDLRTASKVATLPESDRVTSVAFSHDGRLLASGGWGKEVHLWK